LPVAEGRTIGVFGPGRVGVVNTGGGLVGPSTVGRSVKLGSSVAPISVSSMIGVVIAGSVPRYTYAKRVALGVVGTSAGALRERPISKTRTIPITEHPLMKIGIKRLRSKAGWLSMENMNMSVEFVADEGQLKKLT
jgi:hypothetical protein